MLLNSMRTRMTMVFASAIAFLMLITCGWQVWYTRRVAESNAQTLLNNAAYKIRDELLEDNEGHSDLTRFVREKGQEFQADGLVLALADAAGNIVAKSQSYAPDSLQPGVAWRTITIPVKANAVLIAFPWHKEQKVLRGEELELFYLGVLVTLAAAIGSWLLIGRTLSPIDALATQAQDVSGESLHVRLKASSPDAEVVKLVTTLNGLLARLAEAAAARGRFYAAASHELRTPLHALSGHLEVGLSQERSKAEYRAALEEAYQQTQRLTALVQDLLLLTQLQGEKTPPGQEPVPVAEICDRTIQLYTPLIEARHLQLRTNLTEDVEVVAPQMHLEMLVRNLVENAVKYATEGGEVLICLGSMVDETTLEIFNSCPLLPLENLDQLLEPFFRPDESRNSETGGNGLGLAICHTIAVTNHWRMRLRQEPEGFRVSVAFVSRPDTRTLSFPGLSLE